MNKRRNIYLMYMIVFLQGLVFYGPVATIYRQARGVSMYEMFLIESVSWILMIVFEVPWGWFADRFGYKKTLLFSNFLFFISKIIFFKADSFALFLIERVMIALVFSGISGCDVALIYSSVDEEESEKVFGRYSAFSNSGFLVASFMSSIIVSYSLDSTALFTIIPYGIAAVLTLFLKEVKSDSNEKPKFRESLKTAFKNKQIIIFILSMALFSEVVQAVGVFLNQPQYLRSGINIKHFGILMVVIQIVRLGAAKSHKLSKRFGKNKTIEGLYVCITISCILLIFTSNPIISVVSVIVVCGSMSLIGPIALDIENKAITTGDRATILSIYAMVGDVVSSISNMFIGKTADISVQYAFTTCTVMCICGYGLFTLYKRTCYKKENVETETQRA